MTKTCWTAVFFKETMQQKTKRKKISVPVTFEEMCATVTQCLSYSLLSYRNLKTTSFCVFSSTKNFLERSRFV